MVRTRIPESACGLNVADAEVGDVVWTSTRVRPPVCSNRRLLRATSWSVVTPCFKPALKYWSKKARRASSVAELNADAGFGRHRHRAECERLGPKRVIELFDRRLPRGEIQRRHAATDEDEDDQQQVARELAADGVHAGRGKPRTYPSPRRV